MDYQDQSQVAAAYPYPYPYPTHHQHNSPLYPPQQQNPSLTPTPFPCFNHQQPQTPLYGVASVAPPAALSPAADGGGEYAAQTTAYGAYYDVGTGYYHDPNWVGTAPVEVYGTTPVLYPNPNGNIVPPNGPQQFVTAKINHNVRTNQAVWHQGNNRKRVKKIKIPQLVRCDVCKIMCDTQEVLDKHRLGKKHKKNLEKLKSVVSVVATTTPTASVTNSVTSLQEAPNLSKPVSDQQTSKKKASPHSEDLETKRRKIVNCGAAVDAVRTCSVCKVVCNSETVFQSHLAGQKHAAMVKKQVSGTKPALVS